MDNFLPFLPWRKVMKHHNDNKKRVILEDIGLVASCYLISTAMIETSVARFSGKCGKTGSVFIGAFLSFATVYNVKTHRNGIISEWILEKRNANLLKK